MSASVGAGHDGAARELARRLREAGHQVDCHDFLRIMPGPCGTLLNEAYQLMLSELPGSYQLLYTALERSRTLAFAVQAAVGITRRRLRTLVPAGTRAVVSTYPLASQVLGQMRLRGELTCPTATFLTDFSVHRLWVAEGVDAHLALHAVPAAQATRLGARGVKVSGPLVAPRFAPPAAGGQGSARERFGLPAQGRLALLVAGSWGWARSSRPQNGSSRHRAPSPSSSAGATRTCAPG